MRNTPCVTVARIQKPSVGAIAEPIAQSDWQTRLIVKGMKLPAHVHLRCEVIFH